MKYKLVKIYGCPRPFRYCGLADFSQKSKNIDFWQVLQTWDSYKNPISLYLTCQYNSLTISWKFRIASTSVTEVIMIFVFFSDFQKPGLQIGYFQKIRWKRKNSNSFEYRVASCPKLSGDVKGVLHAHHMQWNINWLTFRGAWGISDTMVWPIFRKKAKILIFDKSSRPEIATKSVEVH